ncbi:hypothetical protein BMW22_15825 [Rhizobium leguminosarum]|uniref:RNA polymerase sigma-70 region 4 domain-containing protein n=1 Tax=Rhizobium leguminosarum TaxID=384 RepID=A0A1L3ZB60_RHILE|nr:sigma factor-like helix-turn-helix DNA-binding protein [Rhizobium leguminosarum]API52894.1 hypothetical protein BMW22_15825 [Rhizobium leguminosarum]
MRAETRILLDTIRFHANSGLTRDETAERLGLRYQTIVKHALAHGIEFKRKKDALPTNGRNAVICERYLNGEKQIDLSKEFGITRERVRQIIERAGLVSETKRHEDYVAIVAGTVVRKGFTVKQAAEYFGTSRLNIFNYCVKHGVTPARMTAEERAELNALALQVVSGKSIRQAVHRESAKAEKLRRHLINNGITARGRSRWDDFSERKRLLEEWKSAGLTWEECAAKLSKHDGRKVTGGALVSWCSKHMRHLVQTKKASGLPKGVTIHKGRFMAQISLGGRSKYIGSFDTPDEAHVAYLVKLHESRPASGVLQ